MSGLQGARIEIAGIVQGVGFRPFVYGLARDLGLSGSIRNTSGGVDIEVSGDSSNLNDFLETLTHKAPPLAQIQCIQTTRVKPNGATEFRILPSTTIAGKSMPVSADVAICDDCLKELFDPNDRRYRYPFINCTNCGPRYTIIADLPYDRPLTSMQSFPMCLECSREYTDPLNRRFHAQPVACPACGPSVWLEVEGARPAEAAAAIAEARNRIKAGQILAVKGLGGYHLACDATNPAAVTTLRLRKKRVGKPLAVMVANSSVAERYCRVSRQELTHLASRQRPILLLEKVENPPINRIAEEVAPYQNTLGMMLPYTPLHFLLIDPADGFPAALVMTSGNLSEEPIVVNEAGANSSLFGIADAFLHNNRPILNRADDSVSMVAANNFFLIRRARGYAPSPIPLPKRGPSILAVGAELKNTFCLTWEDQAFLSPHIGDLENHETLLAFEKTIYEFEHIFRTSPQIIAADLHPNYLSTRYAARRAHSESIQLIPVQHHHAHVVSCMAENGFSGDEAVIGVAFDGTGLGTDGAIWGGEILVANLREFERHYHLKYVPLLGGDLAARQCWRMGYAWLREAGLDQTTDLPLFETISAATLKTLVAMAKKSINCPPTSSMGRLFDAVASIIGIRQEADYEAQAAIELEALGGFEDCDPYHYEFQGRSIDPAPMIGEIVGDYLAGTPPGLISSRFHRTISQMVLESVLRIREKHSIRTVALSGGVWQNRLLLEQTVCLLEHAGFTALTHKQLPCNDGGLSFGQAVIAGEQMSNPV